MWVAVTGGSIGNTSSKMTAFPASRMMARVRRGAGPGLAILAGLNVGGELEGADVGASAIGERLEEREAAGARAGALPPPEGRSLEGEAEHRIDVVRREGRHDRAVGAVGLRDDPAWGHRRPGADQWVPSQVAVPLLGGGAVHVIQPHGDRGRADSAEGGAAAQTRR